MARRRIAIPRPAAPALVAFTLAAIAAALVPAAAAPAGPKARLYSPPGLAGLQFALPTDWGESYADRGWLFAAKAPGHVADIHVGSNRAQTLPFGSFASGLAAVVRKDLAPADPLAKVTSRTLRVGTLRVVEIFAKYHGAGAVSMMAGDRLVVFIYGFQHAGRIYLMQYTTSSAWLGRKRPEFRRSISSVRFANVA